MKRGNQVDKSGKTIHSKMQPVVVKHVIKDKVPPLDTLKVKLVSLKSLLAWAKFLRKR